MRIRRALPILAALAATAAAATAVPAHAATTGATTTTFSVTGSGLSITVPASVNLGSGVSGGKITGSLGTVTVTDGRGLLLAAWTASVTSSAFTTGGGTTPETIPAASVTYASLLATSTTGTGVFTPGEATTVLAAPLSGTATTAFTLTAGVGPNSAAWDPTITVNVPAAAVVGTYTGTITHSVA